ncbi:unnamed protein product [Blepharisma stoltei]|uniref:Uncharacterized protein n=1 Tax=Blepharisma stoltei TaxID=1481888 RepID=A0AAU9J919_9CILI|nr:unnamed protein product [Blepharisma stoltei]
MSLLLKKIEVEPQMESKSLFLFQGFDMSYYIKTNLETFVSSKYQYKVLEKCKSPPCICSLPNDELFCYGFELADYSFSGSAYILNSYNRIKKLPDGIPCFGGTGIYYENAVYIFGGSRYGFDLYPIPLNNARKFDFLQNKWMRLANLPEPSLYLFITEFFDEILIAEYEVSKIYSYDIFSNIYSEIPLELAMHSAKILFRYEDRAYLIDSKRMINVSGIKDSFTWENIGQINRIAGFKIYQWAYYSGSIYFGIGKSIYKFFMKKKVAEIERVITKCNFI